MAHEDVARRPGHRRPHGEDQGQQRDGSPAAEGDDAEPDDTQTDAGPLEQGRALGEHEGGDDDGDHGLELEDERGQPGRHPRRERGVEQPELAQAHGAAHEQDPAQGRRRAGHEGQREQDDGEAERDEQQRRDVAQAPVDDDEVHAPQDHDEAGGEDVLEGHATILAPSTVKHQRRLLHETV